MFFLSPQSRHVQISNEEAIGFYKKFGFEIVGKKENYYKRIDPPDAFILQKEMKTNTSSEESNGASK